MTVVITSLKLTGNSYEISLKEICVTLVSAEIVLVKVNQLCFKIGKNIYILKFWKKESD